MANAALCQSIADSLADYRVGEITKPTAAHVTRWVSQFDPATHDDILVEIDHILKQAYLSRANVTTWLAMLAANPALTGTDPKQFWSEATLLKTQGPGKSQTLLIPELEAEVQAKYGTAIGTAPNGSQFVYLDDGLFSGRTVFSQLEPWVANGAPATGSLEVIVVGSHALGEFFVKRDFDAATKKAGKKINLRIWRSRIFEDRLSYINASEVLRPIALPQDAAVQAYVAANLTDKWAPKFRAPAAMPSSGIFYSSKTRDVLEAEFLRIGAFILSKCAKPKASMRPLGFSSMKTLGFGTLFMNYRNCPNNAPLALWWGDPDAYDESLSCWYPLVPRRAAISTPAFFASLHRAAANARPFQVVPPSQLASMAAPVVGVPTHAPPTQPTDELEEVDEGDEYEGPVYWEAEANDALEHALGALEFDYDEQEVRAPAERGQHTFTSRDSLEQYLSEVYDEAWYANVAFDGGEAVFDSDSAWAVTEALEDQYSEELRRLGWS